MVAEDCAQEIQDLPIDVVQSAADKLYLYLHDLLYNPREATLNADEFCEPFTSLVQGLLYIGQCINESRALASELAEGNLSTSYRIASENEIASDLKSLQSTLVHISWQVGQVAKGDYSQHLSFAGAFSESINDMIAQLKEREEALRVEISINQQMATDARNTTLLLEGITRTIEEFIVVVGRSDYEWLYTNHEVSRVLHDQMSIGKFKEVLNSGIADYLYELDNAVPEDPLRDFVKIMGEDGSCCQFFSVVGYPITWLEHKAIVLILADITAEQQAQEKLKRTSNRGTLAAAHSRHYGMTSFKRCLRKRQHFTLALVSLDGLKLINDTLGYSVGDDFIFSAIETLSGFGEQALLSRMNGEEFMLLVRHETSEQVRAHLEEMRMNLTEGFTGGYDRSFSFGLIEVDESNELSAQMLLGIADENLYENKRNRKKERLGRS